MRALIQRVSSASVTINGALSGEIGDGILIFLGVTHADAENDAVFLAEKCANLRIFEDNQGKMNLSLLDVRGEALIVSQFTLYGDTLKGRRPNFTEAAPPEKAVPLYERFVCEIRGLGVKTETGRFGAEMDVRLCNSGPVTFFLESKKV